MVGRACARYSESRIMPTAIALGGVASIGALRPRNVVNQTEAVCRPQGGTVKGKPVEYRGVIKKKWLDSLWEEIIPEHFPALRRKTLRRVRSARGRDWDRIDFEFSDGTNLHIQTEPMVRIRAVLWKRARKRNQRLRIYRPILVRWEADRKRRPRQDPFFPEDV